MENDVASRAADAGAAASFLLFGLTLGQWNELVQIFAGVSAIFAGTAAGIYHVHRWRVHKFISDERKRKCAESADE